MKNIMFEISYYKYQITNWLEKKSKLLELINLCENKSKNILDKSQDQTTSFYNNNFKAYSILKPELENFCEEINRDIMFINSWYQIYSTNQFHNYHNHGNEPNLFSGIIFLKYDKNEHKSTNFLNPFYYPFNQKLSYCPEVEEGDMILFPSYLLHQAPINTSIEKRIIVSFNLKILNVEFKNKNVQFSY